MTRARRAYETSDLPKCAPRSRAGSPCCMLATARCRRLGGRLPRVGRTGAGTAMNLSGDWATALPEQRWLHVRCVYTLMYGVVLAAVQSGNDPDQAVERPVVAGLCRTRRAHPGPIQPFGQLQIRWGPCPRGPLVARGRCGLVRVVSRSYSSSLWATASAFDLTALPAWFADQYLPLHGKAAGVVHPAALTQS